MVPLPETVLKIDFQKTSQQRCHVALDVRKCQQLFVPLGHFLILERAKNPGG
jgi:hypothetical protein